MIQPREVIEAQAQLLIAQLRRDETAACAREAELAATRARDTLQMAHRDARQRMHEAIQDERARRTLALTQARAAAETRRRQAAQREASRVVSAAWQCMPEELRKLWRDATSQRAWCRAAIAGAARVLQSEHWDVRCAAPCDAVQLGALGELARTAGARMVDVRLAPDLDAGLSIASAGASYDATLAGLLSARQGIEAELHAQYLADVMQ